MNPPPADTSTNTLPPRRVSLAVFLTLATIASILGVIASGDNIFRIDVRMLEAAQRADLPGLDTVVRISNVVFGTAGALVLGVLFVAVALLLHRPIFVLQLVTVVALRLAGLILKPIFESPRPPEAFQPDPDLVDSAFGYPSGHAFTAAAIITMLTLFVLSLGVPGWAKWLTLVAAATFAVTAMFSRVAIGAHWPTDTVGGVLYGIAIVALAQLIVRVILRRRSLRRDVIAR